MQRYKIWIILALLVLCILTLSLWLSPKENTQTDTGTKMPVTETQAEQTALLVNGPANASFPSASQRDTEINCQMQLDTSNRLIVNEQTRNCFEYFITQFGEKNLQQIQQDYKAYIRQNQKDPALSQIQDLWDRYNQYRHSLGQLTAPTGLNQEDPAY